MRKLEIRPHFDYTVLAPPNIVTDRLHAALNRSRDRFAGDIIGTQCHLTVAKPFLHIYSPYLTFEIMSHPAGTQFVGRFMPQLSIWSLYITLYGATIMTTVGLGILGWVQTSLQLYPWGLWGIPIGLLLLVGLYFSAFVGQSIGATQMTTIRNFVVQSVSEENQP